MDADAARAIAALTVAFDTMKPLFAVANRVARDEQHQGLEFATRFLELSIEDFMKQLREVMDSWK